MSYVVRPAPPAPVVIIGSNLQVRSVPGETIITASDGTRIMVPSTATAPVPQDERSGRVAGIALIALVALVLLVWAALVRQNMR